MPDRLHPETGTCVAEWCDDAAWCSVTCAMDAIGKKWHPVVVERLLEDEPRRFNELADAIDGVTNKVLSESLDDLEAKGLVERRVVDDKPVTVRYRLTDLGRSLEPVIDALAAFGREYRDVAGPDDGC